MDQTGLSCSNWLRFGDILFDVALYPVSGVLFWLVIHDPIGRAEAEFALLLANTVLIFAMHHEPRFTQGYIPVGMMYVAGAIFMAFAAIVEPVWVQSTALFLAGKAQAAADLVPPYFTIGGYVFLGGMLSVYGASLCLVRVTLIRLGLIAPPFIFPWVRSRLG